MGFWAWNVVLGLAWLGYKLVKAPPSPGGSSPAPPSPSPTVPRPRVPSTSPFALPPAAPAAPAAPTSPARPAAASPSYQWLSQQSPGQMETPSNGDSVYAELQSSSGTVYTILFEAQGIDEAGNFVGAVQDNGGFTPLLPGRSLTVPLAAIEWIVPDQTS